MSLHRAIRFNTLDQGRSDHRGGGHQGELNLSKLPRKRPQNHHALYLRLVHRILKAAPSTRPYIKEINDKILAGEMYKALKEACKLIGYEKKLLEHALRQREMAIASGNGKAV